MSLTLPQTSRSQAVVGRIPSARGKADLTSLEVALSRFGANLTDDERKQLQSEKSGLKDADAALKFTLKLDELDPVRRGKVVASKVYSLLQTVQGFGQVVDTYVSSNPEVAALIWGSVKLTFTVLINFTSYFHTFTDLLRGFDHLIPNFAVYEKLFPNSKQLKTSICDFHLAIITCCTEIIKLTRLSWQQKAWAALTVSFEAKIRPCVDNIRSAASKVKDQMELAKTQHDRTNQNEQQENQKTILERVLKSNAEIERLKKEKEEEAKLHKWNSMLKKLSSFDHETAYKNARSKRHKGTAEWIFDVEEFQDWHSDEKSTTLSIAGKIGSGKTILTANIIDYVIIHKHKRQEIAFFFIRFDDDYSRNSETIIRSFVRQVLARMPLQDDIFKLLGIAEDQLFSFESLLRLLGHRTAPVDELFLILDGLDECTMETQHSLLGFLSSLMESREKRVKLMVSARDSVTDAIKKFMWPVSQIVGGGEQTNRDLTLFAGEVLREKQDGDWSVGDQSLIDEILYAISLGGEGMFLWVYLTIEDICTQRSDEDIRQALQDIPRNLPDTFDRALRRIQEKGNADIVRSIFIWVGAVCSPLTLEQLSEVLRIKVNQEHSQERQRVNRISHISAWCENLIHVEYGNETVHFSHHSIQSYLLGATAKPYPSFDLTYEACNNFIGEICLTYLHFTDFQQALVLHEEKRLTLERIPLAIVANTIGHVLPTAYIRAAGLLTSKPIKNTEPTKKNQSNSTSPTKSLRIEDMTRFSTSGSYPFLQYAISNWSWHTAQISSSSAAWRLWQNMDVIAEYSPWTNSRWHYPGISKVDYDSSIEDVIIGAANARRLADEDGKQTCFALHKAIVYAGVLGHQPLFEKAVTRLIEKQLPSSPQLLEILMQPRVVQVIPENGPPQIMSIDSHNLVIDCVSRYIFLGGRTWPPNRSGLKVCNDKCKANDWTEVHKRIARILGGSEHLIRLSVTRLCVQLSVAASNERDYTRILKDLRMHLQSHEKKRMDDQLLTHCAAERGEVWFTRFVTWLMEPRNSHLCNNQIIVYVLEIALQIGDVDLLVSILENYHWERPEGFEFMQGVAVESALAKGSCLPIDLRSRFIEICIPSVRLQRSNYQYQKWELLIEARIQMVSRKAILGQDWDFSLAMHSCAFANTVTPESKKQENYVGNSEWLKVQHHQRLMEKRRGEDDPVTQTSIVFESVHSCIKRFSSRRCAVQQRPGEKPHLRYCQEHRDRALAIFGPGTKFKVSQETVLFSLRKSLEIPGMS